MNNNTFYQGAVTGLESLVHVQSQSSTLSMYAPCTFLGSIGPVTGLLNAQSRHGSVHCSDVIVVHFGQMSEPWIQPLDVNDDIYRNASPL